MQKNMRCENVFSGMMQNDSFGFHFWIVLLLENTGGSLQVKGFWYVLCFIILRLIISIYGETEN